MSSVSTDRRLGVNSSAAIKVPCRAASTAALTLSGEQTVDGVALVSGDRVLVKNQTDATDNGIYDVDTGSWTRSIDFDGNYDLVTGTVVMVTSGTVNGNTYWRVTTSNPITIGSSSITFAAAVGSDSASINYLLNATGAVSQTLSSVLTERVSITRFMTDAQRTDYASGNPSLDMTAAITAAFTYAKVLTTYNVEVGIEWPRGAARVTTLDMTKLSRVTHFFNGGVIIYGTSSGGTQILKIDGSSNETNATTGVRFVGRLMVQTAAGGSYTNGVKINTLTSSDIDITVSGSYSGAAIDVSYSWDNKFNINAANSYVSGALSVNCSDGNVNQNEFFVRGQCVTGLGTVFRAQGTANTLSGDFNTAQTGISLYACVGWTFISPYFEGVKDNVAVESGTSKGNVFLGGIYEVGTSGAAFRLGTAGGAGSEYTRIKGGRYKIAGGATSTTVFALGTTAYEFGHEGCDIDLASFSNVITGTYRGASGGFAANAVVPAQWVSFPSTQIPSSDQNTLDDWQQQVSWTPTLTNVTPGDLSVSYSVRWGSLTKKGCEVTLHFYIATSAFTHTTSAGAYRITGIPYTAVNTANAIRTAALAQYSGITKVGYSVFSMEIDPNTNYITLTASGSGVAFANLVAADMPTGGSVVLAGQITFDATD